MEAVRLTTTANIVKEINSHIQDKKYVSNGGEFAFQNMNWLSVATYHQFAALLQERDMTLGKMNYQVDMLEVLKAQKQNVLKGRVKALSGDYKLTFSYCSITVNLRYGVSSRTICIRDLISAYIFYSITQGDFEENSKNFTAASLRKEKILSIPNPHIQKIFLNDLTVEHENILIGTLFTLVTYLMKQEEFDYSKIKVPSKRKLKPYTEFISGHRYTNCKAEATQNNYKISMAQIPVHIYNQHLQLFTKVCGFEGDKVDDWQYFRFTSGSINAGMCEDRYALSPSLGIKRKLTTSEYYNINSMTFT